jgi:hypothetical protein
VENLVLELQTSKQLKILQASSILTGAVLLDEASSRLDTLSGFSPLSLSNLFHATGEGLRT